jgi:hypothetical protein
MTGIFDALKQMPKREPKKFFVKVEGKDYEVSLEKKKWAMNQGEENLIIKDGEITVKPPPKLKTQHMTLIKAEKGYVFQDNDIHWPRGVAEGGVTWQIEHE